MNKFSFDIQDTTLDKTTKEVRESITWTNRNREFISSILDRFSKDKKLDYLISQEPNVDYGKDFSSGTPREIINRLKSKEWDKNKGSWGSIQESKSLAETSPESLASLVLDDRYKYNKDAKPLIQKLIRKIKGLPVTKDTSYGELLKLPREELIKELVG